MMMEQTHYADMDFTLEWNVSCSNYQNHVRKHNINKKNQPNGERTSAQRMICDSISKFNQSKRKRTNDRINDSQRQRKPKTQLTSKTFQNGIDLWNFQNANIFEIITKEEQRTNARKISNKFDDLCAMINAICWVCANRLKYQGRTEKNKNIQYQETNETMPMLTCWLAIGIDLATILLSKRTKINDEWKVSFDNRTKE